jgi:exosortase C (VPDSG-CTERM-specific)
MIRLRIFGIFALVLSLVLMSPLRDLAMVSFGSDLHSHIVLIPFISAYLIYWKGGKSPLAFKSSPISGALFLIPAAALAGIIIFHGTLLSETDRSAVWAGIYLSCLWSGAFFFLGRPFLKQFIFPIFFLIFIVPLPDAVASGLESGLMAASAIVAQWLFAIAGIPVFRDGQFLQIPGMALEVARECSGIRSTWVLFITSLVVAYLFSSSPWRRSVLVSIILPLGILRNAFRILIIGVLCIRMGPEMIDSWIHHRGGPVFFAISLVPVFLLTLWLRRAEVKSTFAEHAKGKPLG